MAYRTSRYMQRRQRTLGRVLAQALGWLVLVVAGLLGALALLAAPLAEWAGARALNTRGFGPASFEVTRLDFGGLSLRGLKAFDGAVALAEIDVLYSLRELLTERRVASVRVEGLETKLTWAADGAISLGPLKLFPNPNPAQTAVTPSAANTPPQPTPQLGALSLTNSKLVLALPSAIIVTDVTASMAQDLNGRAIDVALKGIGDKLKLNLNLVAVQPTGKPAQGSAELTYDIAGLDLPELVSALSGKANIALTFDAQGARANNSHADVAFTLAEKLRAPALRVLGLDGAQPMRLSLAGVNNPAVTFNLDRGAAMPTATFDVALGLANGTAGIRLVAQGRADVPLGGAAPQDFNIAQLGVSAKLLPIMGGSVDASLSLLEFKGPITVAEGRVAGHLKAEGLRGESIRGQRLESNLAAGLRLDGLSLSFDLTDLWAEGENINFGAALAQGVSRIALNAKDPSAQQFNIVINTAGGATLTSDMALVASVPRIVTGDAADPKAPAASLNLPRIGVSGYLGQANDVTSGEIKLSLTDGKLAHPLVHLAGIAADLGFDGARLAGPLSWHLQEAPDPTRPKGLDRRGAEFKANVMLDADGVDITGAILSPSQVEVGTFGYVQRSGEPSLISLSIPPRPWDAPTFLEVFGPLAALTNTSGTLGLDVEATLNPNTIAGSATLAMANFGFTSGAMTMSGLNTAMELNQVWPPRAAAPQRLSFARMVAGVPFSDGQFTLRMSGDGTALITQADIKLAQGAVTGRDLIVPLDGRTQSLAMDVRDVDLGALVNAFATQGLAATGKLSGRLPLKVDAGRLFIDRAKLAGRNGTITYAPATPPAALAQGGGNILLQALANFNFEEVTANLNGDVTKDLAVGLSLKGHNPDLYGGKAIEFNLTLDGPINQLVREGLSGYRIPDDIKQCLEQMGLSNTTPGN
ncbi:MAG: hypothetical protein EXR11_11430 [Rhodospirillaceae bacterium]|nr:hypothetical protein [Rhodospirillaceae bacterium]